MTEKINKLTLKDNGVPLRKVCLFSKGKKIIFLSLYYYPINIVNNKILLQIYIVPL